MFWDTYITSNIKESVREKRYKGIRRKVVGQNKLPGICQIASTAWPDGKQVFSTSETRVVGTEPSHYMLPCNHEEADTRIMIDMLDALEHGYSTCLVRTADTDVFVILIGSSIPCSPSTLLQTSGSFLALEITTSLHINAICHSLGNEKSTALPIFHCYTGCDTMTAFCGKGMKSAWEASSSYPEVTQHGRLGLPTLRSLRPSITWQQSATLP